MPILLAGLALAPAAVSQLLARAAAELPLRSVRFPLLGEYNDAFTGEEFVSWLQDNVQGLGGSLDRAEEAAKDLAQREGLLRRLGELGNLSKILTMLGISSGPRFVGTFSRGWDHRRMPFFTGI